MASSNATTVEAYLEELPTERRAVVAELRQLILDHLPEGYEEQMRWGMISYEIPLAVHPDTYNKQPLLYLSLAAQKRHYALYLMGAYGDREATERLEAAFQKAGKKMDMGKSCLRFRSLEDVPFEALAQEIARLSPQAFIQKNKQGRTKNLKK